MKYQKYLVLTFVAALFLPMLSAKSAEMKKGEFNIDSVDYIELDQQTELGFETSDYLPEGFDPYQEDVSIKSLNFIEEDAIDLGFETKDYLPEDFNPYKE